MSGTAQVRSIHAVDEFRAAVAKFEQRIQNALDGLDGQLRRAQEWVDHDRPSHWKRETRRAEGALHQAKLNLERCLTFRVGDERPSCREEREEVRKCEARVEYCRDKTQRVKRWKRDLQHELLEYHGRVAQLKRMLEIDLPKARAALELILRRLAAYQIERAPHAASDALSAPSDASGEAPVAPSTDIATKE